MTDLLPLAVWGNPEPGDLEALKAAKAALQLPYLIVPVPAVAGSPTRVLALRSAPPFIADFMGVRDPQAEPERLIEAMRWALDPRIENKSASLIVEQLQAVFGPGLREIPYYPEPIDESAMALPARRHNPNDY